LRVQAVFLVLLVSYAVAGCGKPVPADKASYVGEWQTKTMYLLIAQDGSVEYKRLKGGATTSITGPLKGFKGDDFEVGIGPMSTTFEVTNPPHAENGRWKMTVDGVQLTKTD
jgi:hypothetical protein